ncbi:MAG: cytidine deaminase, partial [Flavobacteriales bacterium]
ALIERARQGLANAYAPYSDFPVSCALQLDNGEIVVGTNQENAAYPSGLCAERVAVFYAKSQFPKSAIIKMAIVTGHQQLDVPVAPCGACRQVLLEYQVNQENPMVLLLTARKGTVYTLSDIRGLLPLHFSKVDLKKPL